MIVDLRFPDPTNPARVYVVDVFTLSAVTPREQRVQAETSRIMGTRLEPWTHRLAYRWHAEDGGATVFSGSGDTGFVNRYPTPREHAEALLRCLLTPHAPDPDEEEETDG